jgi:hypothetical protein
VFDLDDLAPQSEDRGAAGTGVLGNLEMRIPSITLL